MSNPKATEAFASLIDQSVKAAQAGWGLTDSTLGLWSKTAQAYQAEAARLAKTLVSYSNSRASLAAEYVKDASQRDPFDTAGAQASVQKTIGKVVDQDQALIDELAETVNEHYALQSSTLKEITSPVDAIIGAQQDFAARSIEFGKSILASYYELSVNGAKDLSAFAQTPQWSLPTAKKSGKAAA